MNVFESKIHTDRSKIKRKLSRLNFTHKQRIAWAIIFGKNGSNTVNEVSIILQLI